MSNLLINNKKPIISVTFDDGIDVYENCKPYMQQRGIKGTWYIVTGQWIDKNEGSLDATGYINLTQIRDVSDTGHEIGSHTVNHNHMTSLDVATQRTELSDSKSYLESVIGKEITSFAPPANKWGGSLSDMVKDYYEVVRCGYSGWLMQKYPLGSLVHRGLGRYFSINSDTVTAADVKSYIDDVIKNNAHGILLFHNVRDTNPNGLTTNTLMFQEIMDYIKANMDSGELESRTITESLYTQASDLKEVPYVNLFN